MVKFINFTLLLSTIASFSLALPIAKQNEVDIGTNGINEDYYVVYIDERSFNKRSEVSSVEAAIKDINKIIKDGRRLYKDKSKLKELEEQYKESELVKRDGSNDEPGFSFPLYSHNGYTVLHTYLHPGLVEEIDSLPYVGMIEPETKIEFASKPESFDKILKETGWKDVTSEEAQYHLSLISQDASDNVDEYDNTYYYPSSAGKDVDIYLFEAGYNFDHVEFRSTMEDRFIKCIHVNANSTEVVDLKDCKKSDDPYYDFHGEFVSTIAGGRKHGVARKANIYGTVIENVNIPFINKALYYIKDNLLKANKSVFNFSFISWTSIIYGNHSSVPQHILDLQDVINEITEAGGIFVSSSGNNGFPAKYIYKNKRVVPCTLDNVICVGGVANQNSTALIDSKDGKVYYRKEEFSNYGQYVDLYAPYAAEIEYINKNKKNVKEVVEGTSFAAPIVSGLAATIISEHDDIKFTHDKMLKYLRDNGQKGIISGIPHDEYNTEYDEKSENSENVFVNNGKHMIFPKKH